ncbi:helix-turn-helix domain-containing protein [Myroides marinus]|uniref:helix-turn-helix domain-containing protein n=1 Tax=Myroides marinus TaxID=703342 RepID=UPI002576D31C|nr:helix-turn-helix domain-containing protein [Myroides marinus]MDM1378223.1 AraC family transcriptional regulator [Myroides marinus]MDM1385391.1 AraC family transcriptional regulator [Myroides marinus]MDM1392604.1 AraC family transcriptional regulator [Myroides marinus]
MQLAHHKPTATLLPYINRYYWGKSNTNEDSITMFPLVAGTGVDVYIHFGTSFYVDNQALSTSHILCPRQHANITTSGDIDFIAIRFNHGAFRHFSPINFNELHNSYVTVHDLWTEEGDILIDKLYHTSTIENRIQLLDEFFTLLLLKHQCTNTILDQAMRTIYQNHSTVCISELSQQLNISTRHFERKFKQEFGFNPKNFQVVSRFENTLRKLFFSPNKDQLSLILDSGYYDQSHFIKECKAYTNYSPSEIINLKDNSLHFYFTKTV